MLRIFKKSVIALMVSVMVFSVTAPAFCDIASSENPEELYEGEMHEIYTAEDFLAIKDNPYGKYELKNSINLNGFDYEPFSFYGYLKGNGFLIINVEIDSFSSETRTVYDCNHKPYEAHFAGLFGLLEGAWIEDIIILPVEINIDCDDECVFTGGLCGYMYDTYVNHVIINKNITRLAASGKCWGVGGIAGYGGESKIIFSKVNSTLTCIDKDVKYKDEQFMGGAYALGYIDLYDVGVVIDGYDADHGYVHDGGLVGAYYKYNGNEGWGTISSCSVEGKITFFEDNKNRRAYCAPYIGEVMHWSLDMKGNKQSFVRDEVYDYTADLCPHWDCSDPKMKEKEIEHEYNSLGMTEHKCITCGYTYYDNYTLQRVKARTAHIELSGNFDSQKIFYQGDTCNIKVYFEPADASPKEFMLISDDDSVAGISHDELDYSDESKTVCDAIVRFDIPGTAKISAVIDGEVFDTIELTVKSHGQYIWDTYKLLFIGGGCAVITVICGIIISKGKKNKNEN